MGRIGSSYTGGNPPFDGGKKDIETRFFSKKYYGFGRACVTDVDFVALFGATEKEVKEDIQLLVQFNIGEEFLLETIEFLKELSTNLNKMCHGLRLCGMRELFKESVVSMGEMETKIDEVLAVLENITVEELEILHEE